MITADLTRQAPSPWSGALRGGVRVIVSGSMLIQMGFGYVSFGQPNLNTREARVMLSYGF